MKKLASSAIGAHPQPQSPEHRSSEDISNAPSLLVAIASYGRKQDHYLEQVISEYKKLPVPCRIVVLTEAPKPVVGAELRIGLPSANTYSLPFAHRKLFVETADDHDLFIYTEDDTLLTVKHIEAFLELQRHLAEDEILGFIRSEVTPSGDRYITSINHHFRWLPETVERRGNELFAQFSNQHSGCFVATKAQLRRAIDSGGFMVEPHDEMYGMLESAASDIYRQCGLRRLICVSRIHDLIVPHLANKYFDQMGVPVEELDRQVDALRQLHENGGWRGKLFEPESRVPQFRWSKNLYEKPDQLLLQTLPRNPGKVLSVGVALGLLEELLTTRGIDVTAVALDAVFACALRTRGIKAVDGSLDDGLMKLGGLSFDTIVIVGTLHLVPDPVEWLRKLRNHLAPGGTIVAVVDNTGELAAWLKDVWAGRSRSWHPLFASTGVQAVSPRLLRHWFRASALRVTRIVPVVPDNRTRKLGPLASELVRRLVAAKFIVNAQSDADRRGSSYAGE